MIEEWSILLSLEFWSRGKYFEKMLKLSIVVYQWCYQGKLFHILLAHSWVPWFFLLHRFFRELYERFCNHNSYFYRRGTVGFFSTRNCRTNPERIPKFFLETQDLLLGPFTRLWLLNHRKKNLTVRLTVRQVWVLMNFRVHFKSFLEHEFSVVQIENVFKVNDKSYVFFGLGVFSQATEHNSARPIQHPFWYLYLLVDFCILLDVIKRHEIWLILRTIVGKYCLQRQNKVLNRGFLAQSNSYQKRTVVVRKVFFFKNHIQKIC